MARVLARTTACTLADIEGRLEALGAVRAPSRWRVQCNYLRRQEIFVLQTTEAPLVHFVISAATGVRVQRAGAEHTALIDLAQTGAQRLKVLMEGSVYTCGDFVVRVGQLFLNGMLNGLAAEVEYLPCALATAAAAPLEAFIDVLLPAAELDFCSSRTECFRDAQDLPSEFSLEHSALLLVGLMRARLGVPAATA